MTWTLVCFGFLGANGQVTVVSSVTSELTVNGNSGIYEFTLTNTSSSTINNISLDLDLPQGVKYTSGSIASISGHSVVVTNPANYVFNIASIQAGGAATFTVSLSASCSSIDYQLTGGIFRNRIKVISNGVTLNHTSNPYNILYAALSIISVNPANASIVSGQTILRRVAIVNGGNGSIDNFILKSTQGAEITLISSSHGTIINNSIQLAPADFASIGNGNTRFDQDETIFIDISYKGLSCTDKTISSTLDAGWSSETGFCQNSTFKVNTAIDFSEPTISIATTSSLNACSSNNSIHEQSIKLTNTGTGVAANLLVDIFKSSGTTYDQTILSSFDMNSIMYRINGGVYTALIPISSTATTSNGTYLCLGSDAKGKFVLRFNQLEPGAVLDIKWNMNTCCQSVCSAIKVGGWATNITYADVCAGASYTGSKIGQVPVSASMSILTETEPEISNGEKSLYNYIISNYTNTYTTTTSSRLEVKFLIPAGLKLANENDIQWVSAPLTWTKSSSNYNQSTGVLKILYSLPGTFSIPKSEINLYLTADCSMSGATNGNKSIAMDINFIQDINCTNSCVIPLVCNSIVNTRLQCPDENCTNGGIRNISYNLKRTSFGLPDNNEDGYAEAGNLDFNKVKLNRVMFGDTLDAELNGIVHSGSGITQWSYGFAEIVVPLGSNFQEIGATISIYDQSSNQQIKVNTNAITKIMQGTTAQFTVNFASSLNGFLFEAGDIVDLKLHLKVIGNIGDNVQEITSAGKLYASNASNPTLAQKYYCNDFLDNITLIGYFYSVSAVDNLNVTGCNKTIEQDFSFSIGNCCNNFAGGNLFPFEYRNWASVATAKIVIPPYYKINSVNVKQFATQGTNTTFTQTISNIAYDSKNKDTLFYDLSKYYTNGMFSNSDDGFSGRVLVNVSPTCDIPLNTNQNVYWAFNFKETKYLSGSNTRWYVSNPDRIKFNPGKITIASSSPIQDGISKTVKWNVSLKNPFNNDVVATPWLHLASTTGNIKIKNVIDKSNGDTLDVSNDLYFLSNLTNNETRNLEIEAYYTACKLEKLFVYSGYACNAIPVRYSEIDCPHNSLELSVDPKPTQLQTQISSKIIGGECSPLFEVELLMSSVRLGAIDSLNLRIKTPTNQSIKMVNGSSYMAYPNTTAFVSYTNPLLVDNTYTIPVADLNSFIRTNGLPGVTNITQNKIKLKMQFEMQGNYIPGDNLEFSFNANRTCSEKLPQINLAVDPSVSLKEKEINGLTTESGDNWSVSWGDYNNDGLEDLFITEYAKNKSNSLFKNNGNLSFTKITSGAIVTDLASSIASTWGDYDNDGDLDLFVANNIGSPNFLYKNEGNGTFTRVINGHMGTYDGYSHGATWADYNLDGYLDLFVSDFMPTRPNLLYKNLKNGTFELVTNDDIITQSGHSIGASWADADGDGDPDLFVPNAGEKNFFYLNQGGKMIAQPNNALCQDAFYSVGGSWGDFDNDGDLDLFVANASKSPNQLFINDGNANFTLSPIVLGTGTDDTHGSTWADFDNDGDLDIFITNDQLEPKSYYTNNGDGTFKRLDTDLSKSNQNSFGTAVADIENDGDLDIFIANHSGEENALFVNGRGACQESFCATLVGTSSNRSAIGAKIYATATIYGKSYTQMREISAQTGGGSGGQNTLKVYFGLGNATQIDLLKIVWPSGVVQQIINQPSGNCVTIFEEGGSLISGTTYLDKNGNCVQDVDEQVLANQEIVIQPNNRKIYSNEQGIYKMYVQDGTHTLNGNPKGNFSSACSSESIVATGSGVNIYSSGRIGFQATCLNPDLNTTLSVVALRRGFGSDLFVNIENKGGAKASNVVFKFLIPNGVEIVRASTNWSSVNGDTLFWNLGDINVEEKISMIIHEKVSLSLSIGNIVAHKTFLSMDNVAACSTQNNTTQYNVAIVGAIDPNDKLITFQDASTRDYVLKNEIFNYKIRFQNIGNYFASRVIVRDTLDQKLDLSTIKNIVSSHKYSLQLDGNVLVWTFDNIELPAKETDEEASNGYVSFDVQLNKSVSLNTQVKNTAHIQFDFEDYISTNEVKNLVLNAHPTTNAKNGTISIWPNPADHEALIILWNTTSSGDTKQIESHNQVYFNELSITTIDGKDIKTLRLEKCLSYKLDVSNLESGIYILSAKDILGNDYHGKLIKN